MKTLNRLWSKIALIVFPLFISFNGVSQTPEVLVKNKLSWSSWENELSKEEKLSHINNIQDELINELKATEYHTIEKSINNFHFIDFDVDGLVDIIYYGFAGSESNRTLFFKNNNGTYNKVLDLFGEIIEIWRTFPIEPLSFKLIEYPCCGSKFYNVETYVPVLNEFKVEFKLANKLGYEEGTIFPSSVKLQGQFKVLNQKYVLRSSPSIDNNGEGNKIAEFGKDSQGFALAESTDETGRIWWFVAMVSKAERMESPLDLGNNSKKVQPYILGWMSSNYLEKI